MKNIPKILTIIFLTIFILQLASLIFLLVMPNNAQAADELKFIPQVSIGEEFQAGVTQTVGSDGTLLPRYIRAIYRYAIGIVGIIAAVVLMFGGVTWLTAGGNQGRITEAKAWIGASLTGLIIALTSYLILATVNPALVSFRSIKIKEVAEIESSVKKTDCKELTNQTGCEAISNCFWFGGTCRDNGSLDLKKEDCNAETEGQKCFDGLSTGVCKNNSCFLCESKKGGYCTITPCCPNLICNTDSFPDTCE